MADLVEPVCLTFLGCCACVHTGGRPRGVRSRASQHAATALDAQAH